LSKLEAARTAVEQSRLIELTDKFDLFLEMMGRLGQIDFIIKTQTENIQELR
jgi:hypothetical protein